MIYANEIDEVACAVLRACGLADHVDQRSIKEVEPEYVRIFDRAHFFAGAGLWEVAARLAGWPDDRPLWTASCPCQPFSAAGKGLGTDDPRHLWPDLFRLVDAERPPCIVGEQVAGKAGDAWLDGVCSDLEALGYAFRAVEVPASAVDSPQKRSRNWWVAMADTGSGGIRDSGRSEPAGAPCEVCGEIREQRIWSDARAGNDRVPMASADSRGRGGRPEDAQRGALGRNAAEWAFGSIAMGNADAQGRLQPQGPVADFRRWGCDADARSFWRDAYWLDCADGKKRRAKPDLRLLVDGMAGRTDLWRLAGNSIVPWVAAQVLASILDQKLETIESNGQ